MRIVYFGLPLAALLLLEDGHEIPLAALSRTDCPGQRRLAARLGPGHVYVRGELSQKALFQRVKSATADILVSWFWTTKLPSSMFEAARLGGIGVHPSLLPRHRGPDPYFAAIDQGDTVTGVTVHRIEDEYDTGAILATRELVIEEDWNAWQLARRLDRPSLALLRETLRRLAAGEVLLERKQDEALATWAPLPSLSDCALRWSWPTARLLQRIRALSPAPGAFTEIHGKVLTVLRAAPAGDFPRALLPGEAAVVDDRAVVRTGDGAIELVQGEINDQLLVQGDLTRLVAQHRDLVLG